MSWQQTLLKLAPTVASALGGPLAGAAVVALGEIFGVSEPTQEKIKEIIDGPVVSEIDVETPHGIVTSVITTRSVKKLGLKPGVEVLALVKATEVSIAKL